MITFHGVPDRYRYSLAKQRLAWPKKPLSLVYGDPGIGKSHAVVDCCYRRMKEVSAGNPDVHGTAIWTTHTGIMGKIQMAIQKGLSKESVVADLKAAHILVIDEAWTSQIDLRDTAAGTLRDIIGERLDTRGRNTFVVTNCTPAWIDKNVDDGLASRLVRERSGDFVCEMTEFTAMKTIPPLGRPHILPTPAWVAELGSVVNDVMHADRETPMTLAFLGNRAFFVAKKVQQLPDAAFDHLQQSGSKAFNIIWTLKQYPTT